ncbi:hypothetical protein LguiA_002603 [Lonicera macranthoides]
MLHQVLREKRDSGNGDGRGKIKVGDVYLVGTEPGFPELLTMKTKLLYVGKTAGYHNRT